MSENVIVYTKPLLSTHTLSERVFADNRNIVKDKKDSKSVNRKYIGKYCLVDWMDDSAVIDCSLIHEWD
ncbi:MAG: hypothetical protein R8G33_05035 [Gammaproteobacteria bacterium]|nr:hypothetical protein [Gammaproteobacteria bacterium]